MSEIRPTEPGPWEYRENGDSFFGHTYWSGDSSYLAYRGIHRTGTSTVRAVAQCDGTWHPLSEKPSGLLRWRRGDESGEAFRWSDGIITTLRERPGITYTWPLEKHLQNGYTFEPAEPTDGELERLRAENERLNVEVGRLQEIEQDFLHAEAKIARSRPAPFTPEECEVERLTLSEMEARLWAASLAARLQAVYVAALASESDSGDDDSSLLSEIVRMKSQAAGVLNSEWEAKLAKVYGGLRLSFGNERDGKNTVADLSSFIRSLIIPQPADWPRRFRWKAKIGEGFGIVNRNGFVAVDCSGGYDSLAEFSREVEPHIEWFPGEEPPAQPEPKPEPLRFPRLLVAVRRSDGKRFSAVERIPWRGSNYRFEVYDQDGCSALYDKTEFAEVYDEYPVPQEVK